MALKYITYLRVSVLSKLPSFKCQVHVSNGLEFHQKKKKNLIKDKHVYTFFFKTVSYNVRVNIIHF